MSMIKKCVKLHMIRNNVEQDVDLGGNVHG